MDCLQGYCKNIILANKDIVSKMLSDNFFPFNFWPYKLPEILFESLQGPVNISYRRGQLSSLVAHWLSVPGDHDSDTSGGEIFSSFFLNRIFMIAVYLWLNS